MTCSKIFDFWHRETLWHKDGTNIGKFDVPGGRIKPGQHFKDSLLREIKEETGLDVEIKNPFHVDEWSLIINNEQTQIVATFFECITKSDKVNLSKDHKYFLWIKPEDYKNYNLITNLKNAFETYLKIIN